MSAPILAPAAMLVFWSMVVLFWVMFTRFSAFKQAGVDLGASPPGGRYQDIQEAMPDRVNWKSHNYTHLMEQPTIFYAAVAVLALAGDTSTLNTNLAWAYCGLRVMHSIWQGLFNTVPVRFVFFLLSSLCLLVLAVNAVRITVF
jgi:uncharacterized MAPEG superfamily protein